MAARAPIDPVVRDRILGSARPGVELYIYDRGTTDETTVYLNETGTVEVPQPLKADLEGGFPYWVAGGTYDFYLPADEYRATTPINLIALDAAGLIDAGQLPATAEEFLGAWDASTNTPELVDGTGNAGDSYRVTVLGTQTFGGTDYVFEVGDLVEYDGSVWFRVGAHVRAAFASGLNADKGTAAAYGPGFYFASDLDGGTLWGSDGVSWTKVARGLSEAILKSILTNEGDLIGFNGSSIIRIPKAASDNLALVSRASATGGVDWEARGQAPRVTALPGSPSDGDECVFDTEDGNGTEWRLKYDDASGKWRFIGGPPIEATVDTAENTSSASYAALTTALSLTLPLAGDYLVTVVADMTNTGGSGETVMAASYDVGATGALDTDAGVSYGYGSVTAKHGSTATKTRRKTGLAAATSLTAKYRLMNGTNTVVIANRSLRAVPIRVS